MKFNLSFESEKNQTVLQRRIDAVKSTPLAKPTQQNTYRGLQWDPSRMPINPVVFSADREFLGARRALAWNTVHEILHNWSKLAWLVRQHLAYVALFGVSFRTADPVYNREVRAWLAERSDRDVFDVQRRMGREDMAIAFAGLQVLGGYAAQLLVEHGRGQLFESWNVARGAGVEEDEKRFGVVVNRNGVVLDENGAIDFVAIATGDTSASLRHRYLAACPQEIIIDGYSDRSASSLWESPLMSVLNEARDSMDLDQYELIKAKLDSMFVVYRQMDSTTKGPADFPTRQGPYSGLDTGTDADLQTQQDAAAIAPQPPPLAEIRSGMMITGEKGEDMKFLQSQTPSKEYIEHSKKISAEVFAVLDLPLSFYDSSIANYSSLKADSVRYSQSLTVQQQRRKNARNEKRVIRHMIRDGISQRDMPMWTKGKYTADTLPFALIARAPWILDPSKELPAMLSKLGACLTDFEQVCDELNSGEFYDLVDRQAEQRAYAAARGVPIMLGSISNKLAGEETSTPEGKPGGKPVPVTEEIE